MSNPFAIGFNTQMPGGAGAIGYGGGTQGAGGTKAPGLTGTRSPYENDMADFHNSIAGWNGAPRFQPGERLLDING